MLVSMQVFNSTVIAMTMFRYAECNFRMVCRVGGVSRMLETTSPVALGGRATPNSGKVSWERALLTLKMFGD